MIRIISVEMLNRDRTEREVMVEMMEALQRM
jgi:hypothetical protein